MEFKGTGKKWKRIGNEIWNEGGQPIIIGLAYPHNPANISVKQQQANAQLISKAPEMLEMLNRIFIEKCNGVNNIDYSEIENIINEATKID